MQDFGLAVSLERSRWRRRMIAAEDLNQYPAMQSATIEETAKSLATMSVVPAITWLTDVALEIDMSVSAKVEFIVYAILASNSTSCQYRQLSITTGEVVSYSPIKPNKFPAMMKFRRPNMSLHRPVTV